MDLVFRQFWAVAIIFTVVQGVMAQRSLGAVTERDPSLAGGYRRLFIGYYFWTNVPWLLMGVVNAVGHVPSSEPYFLDLDRPLVRAWWIAMAGLLALGTLWMLFLGGAESLARHPGLPFVPRWSAGKLKLFWIGVVIWNVVIVGSMTTTSGGVAPSTLPGVAFPFAFAGMAVGVSYLLSAMGGWSTLAKDYRSDAPFAGARWSMRSGRLGMVGYGSCLNLGSSADGLYLATMLPFRLGHPPLLIPWSDIKHHDTKRMFVFKGTELRFTKHPTITLQLSRSLAHELLARAPSARDAQEM